MGSYSPLCTSQRSCVPQVSDTWDVQDGSLWAGSAWRPVSLARSGETETFL